MSERPPSSSVDFSLEPSERRPAQFFIDPSGLLHDRYATAPPLSMPLPRAPAVPPMSSPPLHASASPPRPGSHFIRQSTQRAELRFDCTFNRPSITALITITLREETTLPPAPPLDPLQTPSVPVFEPPSGPEPGPFEHSLGVPIAPVPAPSGPSHLQMDAGLSGEDDDKIAEAELEEQYGCRIVEEQPASD